MLLRISTAFFTSVYFLNGIRTEALAPMTAKTSTIKAQDADVSQRNAILNAASGTGAPGGTMASKLAPNACGGQSIEGQMAQINQSLAAKCVAEKKEKKLKLAEAAKTVLSEQDQCVQKVSPQAMNCHVKSEVKKIISEPFYTLKKFNNVTEVFEQNQPIMLTINETFGYTAEQKEPKKSNPFNKSDQVAFKYNRLGGLLSQQGELPQPKKDNPCSACLEFMSKKAESVDGQSENCGGCDSSYSPVSVQVGQFKMQSSKDKDKDSSSDKKSDKKDSE